MKYDTIKTVYNPNSNNFHLMRLIFAVSVVWTHAVAMLSSSQNILGHIVRIDIGGTAVHAFFIVSGFLVVQSAINSRSTVDYFLKRCLRIFPGLFVALFMLAFVAGPLMTKMDLREYFTIGKTDPFSYVWKNLTGYPHNVWTLQDIFSNNRKNDANGSLWTLKHELAMYLIIGILLAARLIKKRWAIVVTFLIFSIGVIAYYVYGWQPFTERVVRYWVLDVWVYSGFIREGFFFMSGAMLYTFRDKIPVNNYLFTVSLFGLAVCIVFNKELLGMCLFLPYIVIRLCMYDKFSSFQKHGDFSYGIYIYHFPIIQIILSTNPNWSVPQLFLFSGFITFCVAYLSWHYIEKPSLKLKRYTSRMLNSNTVNRSA